MSTFFSTRLCGNTSAIRSIVTIPTVIGTVALSCMAGFALAVYKFKSNLLLFFMFVAGNFVPFQILMVPVRDLTVQTGLYNSYTGLILFHIAFQTGFCTLFMRNFIKALPFELIESARVEGVSEIKIFWHIVLPADAPGNCGACRSGFHLHLERIFLGNRPHARIGCAAGDSRTVLAQWPMDCAMASGFCRCDCRCHAAGDHVLPGSEAFYRGPDIRRDQGVMVSLGLLSELECMTYDRHCSHCH